MANEANGTIYYDFPSGETRQPFAQPDTPIVHPAIRGEKGEAGLQGPAGADGVGVNFQGIANVPLSGERVVRFNLLEQLVYASNVPFEFENICGITNAAASAGGSVEVISAGEFRNIGWNWSPGAPLFLGLNGFLTETPPTTGVLIQFATAISSTKIFISIENPIFL